MTLCTTLSKTYLESKCTKLRLLRLRHMSCFRVTYPITRYLAHKHIPEIRPLATSKNNSSFFERTFSPNWLPDSPEHFGVANELQCLITSTIPRKPLKVNGYSQLFM